jgi:DNA/RNA endonuclease YhcR with UshA esterase domain
MKKIFLFVIAILIYSTAFCQNKIPIDSVSKHMGDTVTVCSKVYGVKSLEKVTFINLGTAYPNSPLTIVIFAKDIHNFNGSIESMYDGKNVCVTGILKDFKGKPEIVITKPEEIVIQ